MMAERAMPERWTSAEETQRQPYRSATPLRSGRQMVSHQTVNLAPSGIPRSSRGRSTMQHLLPNARVVEMVQAPLCKSGDVGPSPTACSGRNKSRGCYRAVVELVTTPDCRSGCAGSSPAGPAAAKRQDTDLRPLSERYTLGTAYKTVSYRSTQRRYNTNTVRTSPAATVQYPSIHTCPVSTTTRVVTVSA